MKIFEKLLKQEVYKKFWKLLKQGKESKQEIFEKFLETFKTSKQGNYEKFLETFKASKGFMKSFYKLLEQSKQVRLLEYKL